MPTKTKKGSSKHANARRTKSSARATVSGPPKGDRKASDALEAKLQATLAVVEKFPFNANKPFEYGRVSIEPHRGESVDAPATVTASTRTEAATSAKVGAGKPLLGASPGSAPLDAKRADASGQRMTTNLGVPVADNQHSLKAGPRGPALLEDFVLREKITHFDHERIPERIVHARGSGAHGFFECFEPLGDVTRASIFAARGKRTPVFVRFSTVIGERGSTDTARDIRGFAVKFYTDEGIWDLVGNNIPVFFIQDAMKFPDLVHAAKPEPHFQMPQAATAHDTFWDFVSLMPESMHVLMWAMSDRAIPRSFRMMQGFGVHTFRFVDARGKSTFVKFHWNPKLGTHSLDWDEAVKISGADSDFHRRDLWEAIEAGAYPEWELGVQLFTEKEADKFSFDVLDATKLVPEELVPVRPIGRMVLDRNPDNFFAETEQVAFCTANIVPGLDFTSDPLLAGRIHSYHDTQISRLGGPNFHEIPINAPVVPVQNNQRDGMHRQAIHRGRVAYEPSSLGGGCPFQVGGAGFTSFREPVVEEKLRAAPEKFAEHYNQATLFWKSQTPVERAHIVRGFRFELSRVQTPAIRERMVSMLANVDRELATTVGAQLGIMKVTPMPRAMKRPPEPEVKISPALSLMQRRGDGSIVTRRVAIFVAAGSNLADAQKLHEALLGQGAVPRYVGARLGVLRDGDAEVAVEATFENMPSVLFDAVVVPGGKIGVKALGLLGQAAEFLKDQYRHAKTILAIGEAEALLDDAGVAKTLRDKTRDPGVLVRDELDERTPGDLIAAIARHRHHEREMDPPEV